MRKLHISSTVTVQQLKEIALILFFCNPFIYRAFAFVLSRFGLNNLSRVLTLVVVYIPVLLILIKSPRSIPSDFIFLNITLAILFFLTYCIHPEYEFWYKRSYYGVWDYVLRPDNGLYAYFFIRLVNDPDRISKGMKKSAWIMYVYYLYLLMGAMQRGYWINTDAKGDTIHLSYDLSFGYDVLLFMLVFLNSALSDKKKLDIVMAGLGFAMIFLAGSRGPIMCLIIFFGLFFLNRLQKAKLIKKVLMIGGFVLALALVFLFYEAILMFLVSLMESLGLSSRTLTMLLEGNIADDNGRDRVWNAALQMIQNNPFGYGPMGTRHVIYYIQDVGHPHQIFLEILVDFGVIFGSVIILFLVINAAKMILQKVDNTWKDLFIIFFARACQLMLSGTFWHVTSFWACVGIGVCVFSDKKRDRRRRIYKNGFSNQ